MKLFRRATVPILLFLFVMVVFLIRNAGYWIVDTDQPSQGGTMLVLMGSVEERSAFAADYYRSHDVSDVYVVRAALDDVGPRHSGWYFRYVKRMKDGLTSGGIDSANIRFLIHQARSTLDEAHAMADYCSSKRIGKLTVITSTYHTHRAKIIFKDVFKAKGLTTQLTFPFNTYTPYDYKKWYRSIEDRRTTIRELIKTVYYFLWVQWKV